MTFRLDFQLFKLVFVSAFLFGVSSCQPLLAQTTKVGPVLRYDAATKVIIAPTGFWEANAADIQGALDLSGLQPESDLLTAIASVSAANGDILLFTSEDTVTTFASTALGRQMLNVANAAGFRSLSGLVIGTDIQAHSDALSALGALSGTGYIVKTGASTFVLRSVTGTSGEVVVTNGDGSSGNTSIALDPSVTKLGSSIDLVSEVSGILPQANGGTGGDDFTEAVTDALSGVLGSAAYLSADTWLTKSMVGYEVLDEPSVSDQIYVYDSSDSEAKTVTLGSLSTWLETNIEPDLVSRVRYTKTTSVGPVSTAAPVVISLSPTPAWSFPTPVTGTVYNFRLSGRIVTTGASASSSVESFSLALDDEPFAVSNAPYVTASTELVYSGEVLMTFSSPTTYACSGWISYNGEIRVVEVEVNTLSFPEDLQVLITLTDEDISEYSTDCYLFVERLR